MRSRALWLGVSLLLASLVLAGCGAKTESPLLNMLSFVPDEAEYREWVSFGDAAAWHKSWGIPRIDSLEGLDTLDRQSKAYWTRIMSLQTSPSQTLSLDTLGREDQRRYYGFDVFCMDRYLEAGWAPEQIVVAECGFGAKRIADALMASGYKAENLENGGTLYSIRGDYEVDLHSPSPANRLADRNRIALLDGQIMLARATGLVTDALSAHHGERTSLAGNTLFRASVQALESEPMRGHGELVGVIWLGGGALYHELVRLPGFSSSLTEEQRQRLEELSKSQGPPLPRYDLVAFATQHQQGASDLTVALVFPVGTDAQSAADILAERLKSYVSWVQREPLSDRWSFERATAVEAEGRPVALVTMRVPDPAPTPEDQPVVNASILSWSLLVSRLDLGFLATE